MSMPIIGITLPAMPCLRIMRPQGPPRVVSIYKPISTVGRAATNDIVLESAEVAELHAQLAFDGRDFAVAELEADNSTWINGKKKRRSKIFHQDRLQFGDTECVFSMYDEFIDEDEAPLNRQAEVVGMSKLADFSRKLLSIREVKAQLEALLDAVMESCHADKGFVLLLDGGQAKVTVARHLAPTDLSTAAEQLSDSIVQKVIANHQPLIVSDALHDEVFRTSQSVMNLKLSSVMCVPLLAKGELLGLIYLGNDRVVSLFDRHNLDVLTVYAGQASLLLQNALLVDQLTADRDQLVEQLEQRRFGEIIGSSPSLLEVFRKVNKIAGTDISVLITGETGTGKELIAQELHRRSPRAKRPFVVINCGAIPENLIESELFGHVRGAFTGAVATRVGSFQAADGGTLFLDEVGELPASMQVKLLRALQEKIVVKVGDSKPEAVDIRIVAATHRHLQQEIQQGNFREDLYYRLSVVNLHLPPLRERGDDIVLIAKYFLDKYNHEYRKDLRGFSSAAVAALRKYDWPGNVRQLENRLKKAVVLAESGLLTPDDLDLGADALRQVQPLAEAREEFQRRYVLQTLERNNGNRTKTAHDLGVDPRTIFRYLEREADAPEPSGPLRS